ncbi:MAG TPA: hypothetical protein VKU00_14160 [Chthonomonadaceae bacterium]|nr:hypothetical protein [Chthonomonadaceae bacterium]
MPEENDEQTREMGQLLKQYQSHLFERQLNDPAGGPRNITLPLDVLDHIYLDKLAEKLGSSKTAVAADILAAAVRDMHVSLFGQSLTEQEIADYMARSAARASGKDRKETEP